LRGAGWTVEIGRMLRFGGVGILATATYGATAFAMVEFVHLPAVAGAAVACVAASMVSYFGHQRFSFRVDPDHRLYVWRFVLTVLALTGLNLGLTWLLANLFAVPYRATLMIVTVLFPVMTYFIGRYWIFLPGLTKPQGNAEQDTQTSGSSRA
jgi:putative flippase GtrA